MSNECKKARNVVISTAMILAALIIAMSMVSCGSTYSSCAAYASVEVKNEMKWRIWRNQQDT